MTVLVIRCVCAVLLRLASTDGQFILIKPVILSPCVARRAEIPLPIITNHSLACKPLSNIHQNESLWSPRHTVVYSAFPFKETGTDFSSCQTKIQNIVLLFVLSFLCNLLKQ